MGQAFFRRRDDKGSIIVHGSSCEWFVTFYDKSGDRSMTSEPLSFSDAFLLIFGKNPLTK
jgi:hypothetical protein